MKLTRRELAGALAAAGALAQAPAAPPTPEAELLRAQEQVKAMVARLASEKVPMTVEPAFQFKA